MGGCIIHMQDSIRPSICVPKNIKAAHKFLSLQIVLYKAYRIFTAKNNG